MNIANVAKGTTMHTNAFSGSLFIVAAPSGAGKSTLVNALLAQEPGIKLSISTTTRQPRPGEQDGVHYQFTSADDFVARADRGEFLEWAEVHGNYYGTSRLTVEQEMKNGTDILLEIDWQGARQVKKLFPDAAGIFILPPSIAALEERLHKRGTDEPHIITRRLLAAGGEIAHAPEFEYAIINEEFNVALSELQAIVKATRARFAQQAARNASLFAQLGIHAIQQS
jgi:guanylate kinase